MDAGDHEFLEGFVVEFFKSFEVGKFDGADIVGDVEDLGGFVGLSGGRGCVRIRRARRSLTVASSSRTERLAPLPEADAAIGCLLRLRAAVVNHSGCERQRASRGRLRFSCVRFPGGRRIRPLCWSMRAEKGAIGAGFPSSVMGKCGRGVA